MKLDREESERLGTVNERLADDDKQYLERRNALLLYTAGMAGLMQNAMLHALTPVSASALAPPATGHAGPCLDVAQWMRPWVPEAHNGDRAALQSQRSGTANWMKCAARLGAER